MLVCRCSHVFPYEILHIIYSFTAIVHSNTDIMSALQKFQSETKELQRATYIAEMSSASIDGLKNMMQVCLCFDRMRACWFEK